MFRTFFVPAENDFGSSCSLRQQQQHNNNTTTTQQQHNNNDTTTAKTTYLHPLMGQSNNEQSSPDRPSEQKQTSSRHRPVPLQSFKHTSFSQAKPPRPGGQWQAPVEKCGCNTCTTCRTREKGKKERRKEGKKERRSAFQQVCPGNT